MKSSMEGLRLSPQQKRLWLVSSENAIYYARCLVRIDGPLQMNALQGAIEKVISRHEILRTIFLRPPGMKVPFQVTADQRTPLWSIIDLSDCSSQEQQTRIDARFKERPSFDLEQGPLLHLSLFHCSEKEHLLLVTLPALCADLRTLHHLVQEIGRAYGALLLRTELPDEPVQYSQFSEWLNEQLEGKTATSQDGRHFQRFSDDSSPILPFEKRSCDQADFMTEGFARAVAPEIAAKLDNLSQRYRVSLAVFLLSCWQTLLWRLTGREEIGVAYMDDGRRYDELQDTLGLFAGPLPLRCRFQGGISFSRILAEVDRSLRCAIERQEDFISEMDGRVAPEIASIGFAFQESLPKFKEAGLSFSIEKEYFRYDRFKLNIFCFQKETSLTIAVDYDPGRFRREDILSLVDRFETLLRSVVQNPGAPLAALGMLSEVERHRLLIGFNQTMADFPRDAALHHLFEAQVACRKDQTAVICGDQRLTYAELNARANQLARFLLRSGIAGGTLVGLCAERSVEIIVGLLGVLKAGCAYVPIDPATPKGRLAYQMAHLDIQLLVTEEKFLERLPDFPGKTLCVDRDRASIRSESEADPGQSVSSLHPAYVIYTSGSTGDPKGVAITHQGLVNYTHFICQALQLESGLHFATVSTLAADLGNTMIFPSLVSGGSLHLVPYEIAVDGRRLADYFSRHPVDLLKMVPSHLNVLLASSEEKHLLPRRYLILGGEALSLELLSRVRRLSGDCEVINHYGPTETTVGSLVFHPTREAGEAGDASTVPIGRPIANMQAYILDPDMNPLPPGVAGELYIGGIGLAQGYLKHPDSTAERFLPHPFSQAPGSRLYRTGDLGRALPDGKIEFLGRIDHQVKIRGHRIELGEIEARLMQHPEVREVIVLLREDRPGDQRLVAYVATHLRDSVAAGNLKDFLKESLPDYMIPSAFVFLAAFPLTPNGKADRKALPPPDAHLLEDRYSPPLTATEKILAGAWKEVLRLKRVGIHDNFFDLGGHSLLAVKLMHRIQQATGCALPLTTLFQAPTAAGLAQLLLDRLQISSSILIPLKATGSHSPLYCIDPTGMHVLAYQPLARSPHVNGPLYGVESCGLLDLIWKEGSIGELVSKYAEVIRSHQPYGPYHLLGWSLGGVLALATASALEQAGQTVAFLGILDTQFRAKSGPSGDSKLFEEYGRYLPEDKKNDFLSLESREHWLLEERLLRLKPDERIEEVILWAKERGYFPENSPLEAMKRRYFILKDAEALMDAGQSHPIHAPVYVWWTTETLKRHGLPPIDWHRYTTGPVQSETVEGNHDEILQKTEVHRRIGAILENLHTAGAQDPETKGRKP